MALYHFAVDPGKSKVYSVNEPSEAEARAAAARFFNESEEWCFNIDPDDIYLIDPADVPAPLYPILDVIESARPLGHSREPIDQTFATYLDAHQVGWEAVEDQLRIWTLHRVKLPGHNGETFYAMRTDQSRWDRRADRYDEGAIEVIEVRPTEYIAAAFHTGPLA